jgi:hypothetical protein
MTDEFCMTIVSITFYAFNHPYAPKDIVTNFSIITFSVIIIMIALNFYFLIKELVRRAAPEYAGIE